MSTVVDINEALLVELRRLLSYDPGSGAFTWKANRGAAEVGRKAGTVNADGYTVIGVLRHRFYAHRLAWAFVRGLPVPPLLDHRDRCKSNNAIANLRPASGAENAINAPARGDNSSGYRGVTFHKASGLWHARVKRAGVLTHSSYHTDVHEAGAAAAQARMRAYGEFATGSEQ